MPSGFSLYSVRRPTTRRGSGAAARAGTEPTRGSPIRTAKAPLQTKSSKVFLACMRRSLLSGFRSRPLSNELSLLGRALFRFQLLLRHLERQNRGVRPLPLGAKGSGFCERVLLAGRVAEGLVRARELVVRDVVLGVERDRLAEVGDRGLELPRGEKHAPQAELGLLEVGIVLDRGLEKLPRPFEVARPPTDLAQLVSGGRVRGVEGKLLLELLHCLRPEGRGRTF